MSTNQGPEPEIDQEEVDTGSPIALLADLHEEPAQGFRGKIRSAIERRNLTGQLVELGWRAPLVLLLEWMGAVFRAPSDRDNKPPEALRDGNDSRDQE